MKLKVNSQFIKQRLRKSGVSYSELEEITGININRWKYMLNHGGYVTDTELEKIADILQSSQNALIHLDFQIKQNTPLEIEILVRKLYDRRKGNIQLVYETIMKEYQKTGKLDNLIGEANRLFAALFSGDQINYDLIPALTIIVEDFQKDRVLSGSHAELDEKMITMIFSIITDSFNRNSAQQALAIFLYALILFDVVFLDESIASVTQFTTERFGDKAEQYCKLTCSLEILRNTLIKYMVSNDLKMDDEMVYELTEEIMEGVQLMLLACYKAGQHLNGDYISSEYVNRAELDAIITNLTRRIRNIGLTVPDPFYNLPGSRFGKYLFFLQNIFQSRKPKKWNFTLQDAFCFGYLSGKDQ